MLSNCMILILITSSTHLKHKGEILSKLLCIPLLVGNSLAQSHHTNIQTFGGTFKFHTIFHTLDELDKLGSSSIDPL